MTAKKMARCKRALERLQKNVAAYTAGKPINSFQEEVLGYQTVEEKKNFFKDKLRKAQQCITNLNAKHVT